MFTKAVILPLCVALVCFNGRALAALTDACSTDSDCAAADNAVCSIPTGCVKGFCSQCKTDYVLSGGSCKKDFGKSCAANGDCATGTCTASACACAATDTWSATYKACVTTNKAFGDTCAAVTDCAVLAAANGACTSTACDCASGYIKNAGVDHTCRKPYYGEACTAAVGCIATTGMLDAQVPTCTNNVCECAATDETTTYSGTTFCNTIVTSANKLANTLTCTAHNECSSGYCHQCGSTPTGLVCTELCTSSAVMLKPFLALVLALFAALTRL